MKRYNHLLFDLDGTLADPSEGITKSIAYALDHLGISSPSLTALQSWIGPPIKQSLMDLYNLDEVAADRGVAKYRERFTDIGIYENKLFEGIPELLEAAKAQDYNIYLATSKPTVFAERILRYFKIDPYFNFVGGSGLDDSRPTKAHVIEHVMDQTDISADTALMIGDRKYDIIGGQTFQIDTVGVLYGFGDRTELEKAGATYIVDNIHELGDFLTKRKRGYHIQ